MADEKKQEQSATRFDDNLFTMMNKSNKDKSNLICSPFSVLNAMAIAAVGAKENTLKQMVAVLFPEAQGDDSTELITKSASQLTTLCASYNKQYDGKKKQPLITVANKLFVQKNFPILESFIKASGVDAVESFEQSQAEQAAKTVNDWVAKITQNMIKELVNAMIMAGADLVIANAIYFHAQFKIAFNEKKTRENVEFYTNRTRKNALCKVTMMNNKERYPCARLAGGWTLVKLQYGDTPLSLVLAMEYKDESTPLSVADIFAAKWEENKINLFVPKFKYEYQVELNAVLQQMGITDAFGAGADFSGISEGKGLYISHVIHKAVIEVDEKGTTAAAATAVVMTRSIDMTPDVRFDHPFSFFIVDDSNQVALFSGRFEGK